MRHEHREEIWSLYTSQKRKPLCFLHVLIEHYLWFICFLCFCYFLSWCVKLYSLLRSFMQHLKHMIALEWECVLVFSPSHLSWVWGSSHAGGRRPSLQNAGCRRSLALVQTPSSRGWSLLMSLSFLAELCGPAPASPALCTERRSRWRLSSVQRWEN